MTRHIAGCKIGRLMYIVQLYIFVNVVKVNHALGKALKAGKS